MFDHYLPKDFSPGDIIGNDRYKISTMNPGSDVKVMPQSTYRTLRNDDQNTVLVRVDADLPPSQFRQSRMLYRADATFGVQYLGSFIADIGKLERLTSIDASFDPHTNLWVREADGSKYERLAGYVAWSEQAAFIVTESELVRQFLSSYVDARS